jgi:hypothetical protein
MCLDAYGTGVKGTSLHYRLCLAEIQKIKHENPGDFCNELC